MGHRRGDGNAGAVNNNLPVNTSVTISNGGTLDMTGGTQTIASLSSIDGLGSRVLLGTVADG